MHVIIVIIETLLPSGWLALLKEGHWECHLLADESGFQQHLYVKVRSLTNSNTIYSSDMKRFNDRMELLADERCRIDILSDELKVEAK